MGHRVNEDEKEGHKDEKEEEEQKQKGTSLLCPRTSRIVVGVKTGERCGNIFSEESIL